MANAKQRDKIVALREMLAQRFPPSAEVAKKSLLLEMPELDSLLNGGLPMGGITEIVAETPSCGGQWLLAGLVNAAGVRGHFTALIDRGDGWDPRSVNPQALKRLLWVRGREAAHAIHAADILARDGNFPLILMDMRPPPGTAVDRSPANAWYRLQRGCEQSECVLAVVSEKASVPSACLRLGLRRPFRLEDLDLSREELAAVWEADVHYRGSRATACGGGGR